VTGPLLLPVFWQKKIKAWPKNEQGGAIVYRPAVEVFTQRHMTDVHFAGYNAPLARRLDTKAPGQIVNGAPLVVAMVVAVFEVDHPTKSPDQAWREQERAKVARAFEAHPGGFYFETRGGYRVLWRRPSPFQLASPDDGPRWRLFYWRSGIYLSRTFGIEPDPACADWPRLQRAPHATRPKPDDSPGDGPEELPTDGDPELLVPWTFEPSDADLAADLAEVRRLDALHPATKDDKGKTKIAAPWGGAVKALARAAGEPADEATLPLPSRPPAPRQQPRAGRPSLEERERLWCEKALDTMSGEVARAGRGNRNNAARDAALILGHYAPHILSPRAIEDTLMQACQASGLIRDDGRDAALATIRKALSDGMREPKRPDLGTEPPRYEHHHTTTNPPQGDAMHDQAADHDQADEQQGPVSGPRPAAPPHARPKIRISTELHHNIDQAIAALVGHPDVYTRALTLAQIVDTTDPEAADKKGGPVLRTLPRATLREILTASAEWQRFDPRANDGAGGWKAAIPTDAIVQGVESRGYWPTLRPILGIAQTPFLRRDGSVCESPGYDEATGFALVCREAFPAVPEAPTQDDARRALASILDLFCDFPFVDEPARHVPVAALLTMLAMPALGGANTPAFLFEANTPGTGKGLALDVVCILATGREVAKSPWATDEEMAKVLGAAALEGASVLAFDNISPEIPFGGSAIELVLTCSGQYKPRILGRSEVPTLPWRAVVLGTGNNIVVRGDTRRRVLLCTQQTELENPHERDDFKYPHLRQEARARRGELVCAALTILRAHALAGRPAAGVRRVGSFEEWGAMVASAIAWAGGASVALAMPRADTSDDPVLSALRVLLEAWPLFDPAGVGLRLGALADKLYPPPKQRSRDEPAEESTDDGLGHVREALELLAPARSGGRVRFDVRKLGMVLRAHRGRNLGGRAFKEGPVHHGSKTWVAVDPKTEVGVRYDGGLGGLGGLSSSDAGASRARTPAHNNAHAHAGDAQHGPEKSPKSPKSPMPPPDPGSTEGQHEPPPVTSTPPPTSAAQPRPAANEVAHSDPDEGEEQVVLEVEVSDDEAAG
jgi:hypothetical protein